MKLLVLLLVPLLMIPAYAETQISPTDKETLNVKLTHDPIKPNTQASINIDFINPQTQRVQEHIDYTVAVSKDGKAVFGPIPLNHTMFGMVKIPIEFNLGEGTYTMDIEVEGILYKPIPIEFVSFDIKVGDASVKTVTPKEEPVKEIKPVEVVTPKEQQAEEENIGEEKPVETVTAPEETAEEENVTPQEQTVANEDTEEETNTETVTPQEQTVANEDTEEETNTETVTPTEPAGNEETEDVETVTPEETTGNEGTGVEENVNSVTPTEPAGNEETEDVETVTPEETTGNEGTGEDGGGCLIATATFGSELAPQVQQLRELRDNTVLQTGSGAAFMTAFNQFYYSFSPTIADYERENPMFKEVMKIALMPMLSSLALLNNVEIDSEEEMLGYGIPMVLLNILMYAGIPVFGILKLWQLRKNYSKLT